VIKRGSKIKWVSEGPRGTKNREGIVRAHIKSGKPVRLPKRADPAKFKAAKINSVHDRYLIEILRTNLSSGRPLASAWMAPKAATLEKVAEVVG